jgi:uncharacterized protein (TIGR03086 family)
MVRWTMDTVELHRRSVSGWLEQVARIGDDDWDRVTPCTAWSVRELVNHVVGEERWTVPLMQGRTLAEVGDTLDGDLLGADPPTAAREAAEEAIREAAARFADDLSVHLSYGDESADEYLRQLVADHVVHGWDLAAALGTDRVLDPSLVGAVAEWFRDKEALYREAGAIGAGVVTTATGEQARLLAAFGRDPEWTPAGAAVHAIADAFGAGDVDAIMAAMTDDCVFESTSPAPDGARVVGADAVRRVWVDLFGQTPEPRFETEEIVVAGDRGVLRWRFSWGGDEPGHVRGVDVLRVSDGKVVEKLSYVKG